MGSRGQKPTNRIAKKNPRMTRNELMTHDFYDRREGVSGDIIYVACPHDLRIGLLEGRANLKVFGDITCDNITAEGYNGLPTDKEGVKTVNTVEPDKQGNVSINTDNVPEGDGDKYFTDSRARESMSVSTSSTGPGSASLSYNNSTGVFTFAYTGPQADVPSGNTDDDSLYWDSAGGGSWVVTTTSAAKTALGLGTAATHDVGTDSGDVCEFDSTGYPAADGSQITNITTGLSTPITVGQGGTGAVTASAARSNFGLGTAATAAATDFCQVSNNLSDLTAGTARSNLGLGALAVKDDIDNGDWSGADLAVTNGGTGSSSQAGARSNLGCGTAATYTVGTSSGNLASLNGSGDFDVGVLPTGTSQNEICMFGATGYPAADGSNITNITATTTGKAMTQDDDFSIYSWGGNQSEQFQMKWENAILDYGTSIAYDTNLGKFTLPTGNYLVTAHVDVVNSGDADAVGRLAIRHYNDSTKGTTAVTITPTTTVAASDGEGSFDISFVVTAATDSDTVQIAWDFDESPISNGALVTKIGRTPPGFVDIQSI